MLIVQPSVSDVLRRIRLELLSIYNSDEAYELSRRLVAHVLVLQPYQLALFSERACQPMQLRRISMAVQQLKRQVPIQYILGETEFCGLLLRVGPGVLIPRTETEELLAWIKACSSASVSSEVLDMCCGSGAIALSIKKFNPLAFVHALDVSKEALVFARQNSTRLKLPVTFYQGDILGNDLNKTFQNCVFDLIVSNPPYVMESERASMEPRVKDHEPQVALFVPDAQPLVFYIAIVNFARLHLKAGGLLFFEINEQFGVEISKYLESSGFSAIELRQDLAGKDRMLKASWL